MQDLKECFLRELRLFPVNIISPMLRTRLHPHVAVTRKETDKAWEPSKKQFSFSNRVALDRKILPFLCFVFQGFICDTQPINKYRRLPLKQWMHSIQNRDEGISLSATVTVTLLSRDRILTPLPRHYYHNTGYWHHSQDTTVKRQDTDTTPRTLLPRDRIMIPLSGHYYHETGYWHHSQDITLTRQDNDTTLRTLLPRDGVLTPIPGYYSHETG